MAKCLLRGPWVVHTESGLGLSETVPKRITADWRAVCGKTACTVRRAGWRKPSRPLSAPARAGVSVPRSGRGKACGAVELEKYTLEKNVHKRDGACTNESGCPVRTKN